MSAKYFLLPCDKLPKLKIHRSLALASLSNSNTGALAVQARLAYALQQSINKQCARNYQPRFVQDGISTGQHQPSIVQSSISLGLAQGQYQGQFRIVQDRMVLVQDGMGLAQDHISLILVQDGISLELDQHEMALIQDSIIAREHQCRTILAQDSLRLVQGQHRVSITVSFGQFRIRWFQCRIVYGQYRMALVQDGSSIACYQFRIALAQD